MHIGDIPGGEDTGDGRAVVGINLNPAFWFLFYQTRHVASQGNQSLFDENAVCLQGFKLPLGPYQQATGIGIPLDFLGLNLGDDVYIVHGP